MKYLCRQGKEMLGGTNVDAPPLFVDRHTEDHRDNSRSILEESLCLKKFKKAPSTEYVLKLRVVAIAQLFL